MQSDDVNLKGIAAFLGLLAGTLMLIYAGTAVLSRNWEKEAQARDAQIMRQAPSEALAATRRYFPDPREQPNPVLDLQTVRAREEAELNTYGWIDKSNGVVRIPIDRAMDLLAQHPGGNP